MMRSAACNQGVELRAIYPGECRDSTHVTQGARYIVLAVSRLIIFRVSRRRREMYCGHARLCVCLSVRGRLPTLLHGPGRNLEEW